MKKLIIMKAILLLILMASSLQLRAQIPTNRKKLSDTTAHWQTDR
jgi:hypothetical protein